MSTKGYKLWSEDEVQFLMDHYVSMLDREIADSLGRTVPSIVYKRNYLGLKRVEHKEHEHYEKKQQPYDKVVRYRKRFPNRHNAHEAVRRALRTGKIKRGVCEVCGDTEVEAHHDDYSRPLKVKWLCKKHHSLLHFGTE